MRIQILVWFAIKFKNLSTFSRILKYYSVPNYPRSLENFNTHPMHMKVNAKYHTISPQLSYIIDCDWLFSVDLSFFFITHSMLHQNCCSKKQATLKFWEMICSQYFHTNIFITNLKWQVVTDYYYWEKNHLNIKFKFKSIETNNLLFIMKIL